MTTMVLGCNQCGSPVVYHCENRECGWVTCITCQIVVDLRTHRYFERFPDEVPR